jgi:hypothetical protein
VISLDALKVDAEPGISRKKLITPPISQPVAASAAAEGGSHVAGAGAIGLSGRNFRAPLS